MRKRHIAGIVALAIAAGALGAGLIGPATAAGETPRAWGAGSEDYWGPAPGSYTAVLKRQITAPADGALMLTAAVAAEDDCELAGVGVVAVRLAIDTTPVWSGDKFTAQSTECSAPTATAQQRIVLQYPSDTATVTAVIPVTAGDHTIKVQAKEIGVGSYITSRGLSVVFVPAGGGPLPWPAASPV